MNPSPALDASLKRLGAALDQLEASAERRALANDALADREEEWAILQTDRTRLAVELEGALNRVQNLDLATQEAARRLARAETAIVDALDGGADAEAS